MVDVTQHELVPEHRILGEDELAEMLEEYDVSPTNLPKIKRTDPALPEEAEPNDVVEIARDSRTTDRAVVYRLVVE